PGVPATAGAGQHVVDGGGVAAAVAAGATVADQHSLAGPRGAGRVAPPRDDISDESHDRRHREDTDQPVGFGLVNLGHAAHQHAHRVAETDPVERAEVGVDDQDVHRILLSSSRWSERTTGLEPATLTLAR